MSSVCVCLSDGEGREEEKGTGEIGLGRRGGQEGQEEREKQSVRARELHFKSHLLKLD